MDLKFTSLNGAAITSANQMEAEEAIITVLVALGLIVLAVLTMMLFF